MTQSPFGWLSIVRLGLVQTALGSIVVLATSVMNRVMVVELALPAIIPGSLVAMHYAIQLVRPRLGYGADVGGNSARWIVAGMAVLALGASGAALAVASMAATPALGLAGAVLGFILIGLGVGASGTALLVLLAKRTAPARRTQAATVVWLMMIAGFVLTTVSAGHFLEPFSFERLTHVTLGVCGIALVVTVLAVWGMERGGPIAPGRAEPVEAATPARAPVPFRRALAEVWQEVAARRLAVFVFISMLAYSAEELLLDPFSGTVFGYTPAESTRLSGALHGGVFVGMLLVAIGAGVLGKSRFAVLRRCMVAGCTGSSVALAMLAVAATSGPGWPLRASVFGLGVANGAFAVCAIGMMMCLAGSGQRAREGVRMGLWGAAQGVAFGLGGIVGSGSIDLVRHLIDGVGSAYAWVFLGEAALFLLAVVVALRLVQPETEANTGERSVRRSLESAVPITVGALS